MVHISAHPYESHVSRDCEGYRQLDSEDCPAGASVWVGQGEDAREVLGSRGDYRLINIRGEHIWLSTDCIAGMWDPPPVPSAAHFHEAGHFAGAYAEGLTHLVPAVHVDDADVYSRSAVWDRLHPQERTSDEEPNGFGCVDQRIVVALAGAAAEARFFNGSPSAERLLDDQDAARQKLNSWYAEDEHEAKIEELSTRADQIVAGYERGIRALAQHLAVFDRASTRRAVQIR